MILNFTAKTDVGKKYDHNEDFFFIPKSKKNTINLTDSKTAYFILCDGMGGANSGEVASQLTVNWLDKSFAEILSPERKLKKLVSKLVMKNQQNAPIKQKIIETIGDTNKKVSDLAHKHKQYEGMGTTLVTSIFFQDHVLIYSVGDSRCYRFRNDQLEQLTEDQSEVWELYKMGAITKDEVRSHPRKNIITMSLGNIKEIEINCYECDFQVGDLFLLCSDGLTDMISDVEIKKILEKNEDTDIATKELIKAVLAAGGKDNVTVILIEVR